MLIAGFVKCFTLFFYPLHNFTAKIILISQLIDLQLVFQIQDLSSYLKKNPIHLIPLSRISLQTSQQK